MQIHFQQNLPLLGALLAAATLLSAFPRLGVPLQLHLGASVPALLVEAFTCHLVHWNAAHLFYDALALALLAPMLDRRELPLTLLLSAPAVSLAVLALHPELPTYCGLSGVNCALYAHVAAKLGRRNAALGLAALAGILLKTLLELSAGRTFFATGFIPVHSAHLAGIAAGLISAWFSHCLAQKNIRKNRQQKSRAIAWNHTA